MGALRAGIGQSLSEDVPTSRGIPNSSREDVGRKLKSSLVAAKVWQAWTVVFLAIAGALMLAPVAWVVVNSLETVEDQFALPPVWFPHQLTLASYRELFSQIPFLLQLGNSVLISGSVIVGSTVVSVLAAYAFARLEFWGRDVLFTVLLLGLMLPIQVASVPEFVVVKYLGMLNTRLSLIVPALFQVFGLFLLRQHFRTIPRELDDAAIVDGAGHLRILRHVVLPMSWPAVSAVAIITGQYIWNDYFWPNLYITSQSKMPAALGLVTLQNSYGSGPVGAIFGGLAILAVPAIVFFVFAQKRLMEGIGFTGISR